MRKIHVIRQFFEATGPQGHFFEKTDNPFLDMVEGGVCTKFQACIVFHLATRHTQIHTHTSENRNILDRIATREV